jgi:hypothetical protein
VFLVALILVVLSILLAVAGRPPAPAWEEEYDQNCACAYEA